MKFTLAKYLILAILSGMIFQTADAQTTRKKTPAKKPATTAKKTTTRTTNTKEKTESLNVAAADTMVPPPPPVVVRKDPFAIDTPKKSLRHDAAVARTLIERTPLAYEHIREDDAWFRERVWREIDIREKMNMPFRYRADEDNGNQRFIIILLNTLRTGDVTAFDATVDDRFTTPMTLARIGELLAGKCDSIQIPDYVKDPNGSKGLMKDSVVCAEFNPDEIVKFRIKEEWVFDKESSRMFSRILGIAPIKSEVNQTTGQVLGERPLFWVYYPDMRPTLAKFEVYNGKNFGARMSWEELFESRYFSSYIVKSTFENPQDLFIKGYIKDDILRLLEGEAIKEKIFNFEQDLWSY